MVGGCEPFRQCEPSGGVGNRLLALAGEDYRKLPGDSRSRIVVIPADEHALVDALAPARGVCHLGLGRGGLFQLL